MATWGRDRLTSADERALAGRISGLLWLAGAATLLLTLALPGSEVERIEVVVVVAALAVAWGATMLLAVAWDRAPLRLLHVSTLLGLAVVAGMAAATGATNSPAREYTWFVVVYVAFFFTPRQALAYWLACAAVYGAPLVYDGHAVDDNLLRQLVVVVPVYCLVGAVVVAGRELLAGLSRQTSELRFSVR